MHIWWGFTTEDALGARVAGIGDLDGDGRPELALAAKRSPLSHILGGYVAVYSSQDRELLHLWHASESGFFGDSIVNLGDVNGDGAADTAIGAPIANTGGTDSGLVRVLSGAAPQTSSYCFATSNLPCPCANQDDNGGCAHAFGKGARLFATGSNSLSANDLQFAVVDLPPFTTSLLVMGETSAPSVLQNGILCVGGQLQRFPARIVSSYTAYTEGPGLPPQVQVGSLATSYFQAWYRDSNGPCGGNSNLSNAVAVTWTP